jgi:hypothetical protein
MKTLIKLKIERFVEQEEECFVATSNDLGRSPRSCIFHF